MQHLGAVGDAANPAVTDGQPIEVGVKFRSDIPGYVTWQLVARSNAHLGDAEMWSAVAPASITVVSFIGAAGVGATKVASANSGAPSTTIVTTGTNSLIFGAGNDWNHAIARTPLPDQAIVHQFLTPVDDTY